MPKILIVDDDRMFRRLLRNVLTSAGHIVSVACNGQEALELAEKEPIDIALMDMNMPEMDGWTATMTLKSGKLRCVDVIAVSAYGLPGDKARAAAAGCIRFVSKPIDIKVLDTAIAEVLEIRRAREVLQSGAEIATD